MSEVADTREITIRLDRDVASLIEIRCAIDDLRLNEGIELFLTNLALDFMSRKRECCGVCEEITDDCAGSC